MRPAFVGVVLVFAMAMAPRDAAAAKRARPPEWPREVQDVFFDDARTHLTGSRPDYDVVDRPQASPLQRAADQATIATDSTPWSTLIAPATLETEIKRLRQSLQTTVTTPGVFKAEGFKAARRDFSELAVLFAVIAQYDGDVRWKDVAAGLRDQFSRAGFDAKVGTDETYRQAVEREQELGALIQGERPAVPKAEAAVADWSRVAARPSLMQRIETAHDERLAKWLTDAATFSRNRDAIEHEAQVLALLAEVIHREAYEYWDDELFVEYAAELRGAATETAAAAAAGDFAKARAAATRATGACTGCHAGYRG